MKNSQKQKKIMKKHKTKLGNKKKTKKQKLKLRKKNGPKKPKKQRKQIFKNYYDNFKKHIQINNNNIRKPKKHY